LCDCWCEDQIYHNKSHPPTALLIFATVTLFFIKISVADPDPGSNAFLTPGYGTRDG
jgi:hypothetical protein